jgi:hypothetical protein
VAWYFVQVWVLCLVAFLLGAGVTWLVFVRPVRRDRGTDWPALPAWPDARPAAATPERTRPEPEPDPVPVADPALLALDGPGRRTATGPGAAANDALDQLGVRPAVPGQPTGPPARPPDMPAQSRPADR